MSAILVRAAERPRAASLGLVLEGFRYIWRNKLILGAISLDLFAVLLGGAVALLPVYAREILKVGAAGLGILRSAPGVGAVAMAIVVAHRPLTRRAGVTMLWCVFGFGLFTVVFGLSRNLALSLAALALAGACDMVSVIVRQTMIQLATPDEMRGRVSAVNMVFRGSVKRGGPVSNRGSRAMVRDGAAVVLAGWGPSPWWPSGAAVPGATKGQGPERSGALNVAHLQSAGPEGTPTPGDAWLAPTKSLRRSAETA